MLYILRLTAHGILEGLTGLEMVCDALSVLYCISSAVEDCTKKVHDTPSVA